MPLRSKTVFIASAVLLLAGVAFLVSNLPTEVEEPTLIACTADAKLCPDGSAVGRIGPDCEFAACPDVVIDEVDSFEDCVAAGNPVMESYPRQCRHNDQHFVEDISIDIRPDPVVPTEPVVVDNQWPIRYGEDVSRMEEYRFDCEQRMGVFNECGSACEPGADICMAVCSMICEGPASEHMPPPVTTETDYYIYEGTDMSQSEMVSDCESRGGSYESCFGTCDPPYYCADVCLQACVGITNEVPPKTSASVECPADSRGVDACIEIYQPVCGQVAVQCVTTPCNPVPETFSNSCFACMNENVISYTEGACVAEL